MSRRGRPRLFAAVRLPQLRDYNVVFVVPAFYLRLATGHGGNSDVETSLTAA
jgi:hypothetical protein